VSELAKRDAKTKSAEAAKVKHTEELPSTRFAFRLFEGLDPIDGNLVVSPYGARLLLSLICAGAKGQTREEMAALLGLERKYAGTEQTYEIRRLAFRHSPVDGDGGEEFFVQSSLWCDTGFPIKVSFAEIVQGEFQSQVGVIPFGSQQSVREINKWVQGSSGGRVSSIVERLDDKQPMLAVNAVYFKGRWREPFKNELTREADFYFLNGRKRKVLMMALECDFGYAERKGTQIVQLWYRGTLSMTILLPPKEAPFAEFCGSLRESLGTDWLGSLNQRSGSLRLPKFRMESEVDLTETLVKMGMTKAFQRDTAEFSGISDRKPLFLAAVHQKDFVEVNEEGTEAVAVTAGFLALAALEPPPPFEMIVDRPFVFLIRENRSGAIVFLGAVVDPVS
jgi:serine protease inhibitor